MKYSKSLTFLISILLSMLFYVCFTVEAASTLFFKGDTLIVAGKKYTLDMLLKDSKPIWIWKSKDGKSYQIERAKRKDSESSILTEVIIAKDNTINKRKSSFEIGKDFPKHNPDTQLQQVHLIQNIVDGKLMNRIMYRSQGGTPIAVTGLIFYLKGDNVTFTRKKITLDRFKNEIAIWKGIDDKYYVLEISKINEKAEYVLREVK